MKGHVSMSPCFMSEARSFTYYYSWYFSCSQRCWANFFFFLHTTRANIRVGEIFLVFH